MQDTTINWSNTSSLQMSGRRRAAPDPEAHQRSQEHGQNRKGKSKGKTVGKFVKKWNSACEHCRFQCGRHPARMRCFGSHPVHACCGCKDTADDEQGRRQGPAPLPVVPQHDGSNQRMRVLYLFSGEHRKSSVVSKLKELSPFPQIMIFHKQVARSTAWSQLQGASDGALRTWGCLVNTQKT